MEVHGVDGVLVSLLGCMGWGYGRILGGVGGSSQVIPDLRWEMAPKLNFGVIYGVGIWLLRKYFQFYLVLLAASVAAHMELSRGSIHWNMSFVRVDHN
jgi:hypothetical protein